MDAKTETLSPWRLRYDIVSARVLIWVANPGGRRTLKPEVHLYLADRYGRLARYYASVGKERRARELEVKAGEHFDLGGGADPPPAIALAMPVPRPLVFTNVVGKPLPKDPPDPEGGVGIEAG